MKPKNVFTPSSEFEEAAYAEGFSRVVGIDEAGRGPLAGPVVAAAVLLPRGFSHAWLTDSKKLSAKRREVLWEELREIPELFHAIGVASVEEIDEKNILRATHLAMARAVQALPGEADFCLIDGLPVANFPYPQRALVKGDSRSFSIAAASIFAKVTRDRIMAEISREFPHYGFERHQGYGTAKHLEALNQYGPCRHHRRSFQPVAQCQMSFDDT